MSQSDMGWAFENKSRAQKHELTALIAPVLIAKHGWVGSSALSLSATERHDIKRVLGDDIIVPVAGAHDVQVHESAGSELPGIDRLHVDGLALHRTLGMGVWGSEC